MVAVNVFRAVIYGFRLIVYGIILLFMGLLPMLFGLRIIMDGGGVRQSLNVAVLLFGFGFLVFYAGSLGVLYKVIADAVARGNSSAGEQDLIAKRLKELIEIFEEISAELSDDSEGE